MHGQVNGEFGKGPSPAHFPMNAWLNSRAVCARPPVLHTPTPTVYVPRRIFGVFVDARANVSCCEASAWKACGRSSAAHIAVAAQVTPGCNRVHPPERTREKASHGLAITAV
jgi:hypothetical protein